MIMLTLDMFAQQLPQHIDLSEMGLSFDIPDGWEGEANENIIIMGSHTVAGLMVVFENNIKTASELKELAMKGMVFQGAELMPMEDFTIKNSTRVEGMYQGTFNQNKVKCYAIGLINKLGSGMTILMIAKENEFTNAQRVEANKLANSVTFFQARETQATINWKNKLIGRQLKYLSTQSDSDYTGGYSGTSTRITIDLCSDGSFKYYTNTHNSFSAGDTNAEAGSINEQSGFGYTNANGEMVGTYLIYSLGNQTFLELTSTDNIVYEYDLSMNNQGHTYLDKTRYLVIDSERCN